MITLDSTPRLVPAARLRFDRASGRMMLLCPERGLVLNTSAATILRLCTGEHRVHDLIEGLLRAHGGTRDAIERDVLGFLCELERRRLIVAAPARELA